MNDILHRIGRTTKLALAGGTVVVLFMGFVATLAIVPAVSPATGAQVADWIRGLAGPQPVAMLEGESLAIQDAINRFMAAHDGGQQTISLAQAPVKRSGGGAAELSKPNPSTLERAIPLAPSDVVNAAPKIGWRPFGPSVNGSPAMAETLLTLDPQRLYAGIALVRIDLGQLRLHMMPGTLEPARAQAGNAFPGLGVTPAADQTRLVAAFNGGFKAVNGHYGMMVNGVTLLPPQPGLATLAIYKDGHVGIGVWGQNMGPSPDMLAFRQNCPPIIQDGSINPQVYVDDRGIWGNTVGNKEITWRTAVGITQDGHFLIYAVGNGATVDGMAQALLQAGTTNAMQLDINRPFARFVTYQQTGSSANPLRAIPLLNQMENDPTLYLAPHARDYFYLTTP